MRAVKYCVLTLFVVVSRSDALNCRSNGGPKENELKSVYNNCLKRQTQQGRDYSRNKSYGGDDWRDQRGYNQRNRPTSQWDRDDRNGGERTQDDYEDRMDDNRGDGANNRDDRMYSRNDREPNRDSRVNNPDERDNWDSSGNKRYGRDSRNNNREDRMNNGYDRMFNNDDNEGNYRTNNRGDRMNDRYDRMYSRGDRTNNRGDSMNGNERMGNRDERTSDDRMGQYGYGREQLSRRDDIMSSDVYGTGFSPQYHSYSSSTQFPQRYKREKHLGVKAGQRSKYNPHASRTRTSGYDDSYKNYDRNSSENGSNKTSDRLKACALHCFVDHLEMTGDNGMPDKYLVTHVITKDVQNEDLRDFLQESIEECFQILDNENTEDKCEFSKNLLLCLSEKGRANCDDWKDDIQL